MKIIQSHIIDSNYEDNSFYILLINYINLKELYGNVTIYCNKLAYDNTIKYIPFDEVIIMENKYNDKLLYKLAVIQDVKDDFVYIDSDVLIFSNILDKFIQNENIDLVVQYIKNPDFFGPNYFFDNNKKFFTDNNMSKYDNKYFSTEIIGMRKKFKDKYISNLKNIEKNIEKNNVVDIYNFGYQSLICDELLTYLTFLNDKFEYYELYPDINNIGLKQCTEKYKFTYLIDESKFNSNITNLIKNKIQNNHPSYYQFVENFENLDLNKESIIQKLMKTKNMDIIKNIENILK